MDTHTIPVHMPQIKAKTMLITGASRGIGAATARLAAQQGYAVVINYARQAAVAEQLVQEIRAQGGQALAIHADVADEAQVLRMFEAIDRAYGPLNALVNNAGVVDQFDINVIGSFLCAREAVRRMSRRCGTELFGAGYGQGGAIVNVSSAASRLGSPNQYVDYAASKGAIDSFTIGLAKEVASEGIRVNAVRPGLIDTEIHASGGLPNRVAELAPTVPMQRGGSAAEVAQAILWLLSDAASYTTMSLLDVSGGR